MSDDNNIYVGKDEYRNGAEGFILWCEDNAWIEIVPFGSSSKTWVSMGDLPDDLHPETGKSYKQMWEEQKKIIREALRMENGQFKYRLIVFCWMRGEGKSLLVCLIELWRFCVFPRQKILCGANSKDQVVFVHFDIIKDLIRHSPKLYGLIGHKNIQKQYVTFTDDRGNPQSEIKPISSHTGLLSNINSYTFSDLFKMAKSTFFTELDGSTRWIPNAFGCIDSTVSPKNHILHNLYQSYIKGEDDTLFFSYRSSKEGNPDDYWNPNATISQLNGFRIKFPFGDFEKFFLNLWDAGKEKVFRPEMVEAIRYLGVDKTLNTHNQVVEMIETRKKLYEYEAHLKDEHDLPVSTGLTIDEINRRLWHIEEIFRLKTPFNTERLPEMADLDRLTDTFDTNWALLAGIDRAAPDKIRTTARTIIGCLLKGLIGSRSNPSTMLNLDGNQEMPYIYIMIYLSHIEDSSLDLIKSRLQIMHDLFDGIDVLGGESWGTWDLRPWCEDRNIKLDIWTASPNVQKAMFTEFFNAVEFGRFKAPPVAIQGSKSDDILEEEMDIFDHVPPEPGKKTEWFGSPEKYSRHGIQDDVVFEIGGAMYAGRELSALDFRERKGKVNFGSFFHDPTLLGDYR